MKSDNNSYQSSSYQSSSHKTNPNNPLQNMTLEKIVNFLVDKYGWEELGEIINIRCFNYDPSVKSSLKFLRKTPWARSKVEALYIDIKTNQ